MGHIHLDDTVSAAINRVLHRMATRVRTRTAAARCFALKGKHLMRLGLGAVGVI